MGVLEFRTTDLGPDPNTCAEEDVVLERSDLATQTLDFRPRTSFLDLATQTLCGLEDIVPISKNLFPTDLHHFSVPVFSKVVNKWISRIVIYVKIRCFEDVPIS